jgi:hypothetical protein
MSLTFAKKRSPSLRPPESLATPVVDLQVSGLVNKLHGPSKQYNSVTGLHISAFVLPCLVAFCVGHLSAALVSGPMPLRLSSVRTPNFSDILQSRKSDKFWMQHFEHYYEKWLSPYRLQENVRLLEIGARTPATLQTWHDYFQHPELIQGLTVGEKMIGMERLPSGVETMLGDPTNVETLNLIRTKGPFDIIIDDGSHVPAHMISTLFEMWSSVKPGGTYIIEGLETNYWRDGERIANKIAVHGAGIGSSAHTSAVEKLKQFLDVLARNQIGALDLSVMPGDDHLCSVNWGRNILSLYKCNDLERKTQPVFQKSRYDEGKMAQWLKEAKASNPDGFN